MQFDDVTKFLGGSLAAYLANVSSWFFLMASSEPETVTFVTGVGSVSIFGGMAYAIRLLWQELKEERKRSQLYVEDLHNRYTEELHRQIESLRESTANRFSDERTISDHRYEGHSESE